MALCNQPEAFASDLDDDHSHCLFKGLSMYVGALYDIGFGQKMYLGCNGTGSPTG